VWQPDLRADQVYSRTLETGVTHRLFPAVEKVYRLGVRPQKGLYSEAIYSRLAEIKDTPLILHLHGFRVPFYFDILNRLGVEKKFPIFVVGHGMSRAPISELWELHRPLTYACLIAEQWRLRKALRHVDVISEQAESALREIKRIYAGRIVKLTDGCDFGFWIPAPTVNTKHEMRKKLNISEGKKVFFASGNFVPRKQFQKLIGAFREFIGRDDFVLVIAGHGDAAMTDQLASMVKPLEKAGRAILHPYVEGERLRDLYWASDVFVSVATDEGGPVSVMKAMGCGLPVMTTPVGTTYELMAAHGVGSIVPTRKYEEWVNTIEKILIDGPPQAIDVQAARDAFDWGNIAMRFASIYDELLS
jgi:glycosyltransferase involved in cell wall biosynthesis